MTRVLAVLAILFGLLLLQGSLCGGSGGAGVPCVAGCDRAETAVVEQHHADVGHSHVGSVVAPKDEHGALTNLCATALLAIFALLALVSQPGGFLALPRVRAVRTPVVRPKSTLRPVLCALRL
jgi:hypothetical protein